MKQPLQLTVAIVLAITGCNSSSSTATASKTAAETTIVSLNAEDLYEMDQNGALSQHYNKTVRIIGKVVRAKAVKQLATNKRVAVSICGTKGIVQREKAVFVFFNASPEFSGRFINWLDSLHDDMPIIATGTLTKGQGDEFILLMNAELEP